MIQRYRLYRSYGHGRFIAAGLALPPQVITHAAIVAVALALITMATAAVTAGRLTCP